MSAEPDVFSALADPTRRALLERLTTEPAGATATELAAGLPMTRQAVAKHLGVLSGAGLVRAQREGRETRFRPTPAPLGDAVAWMTGIGAGWDERLAALARAVERRRTP